MDTDEGVETADKATTSTASTNSKTEKAATKETPENGAGGSDNPVVNGAISSGSGTDSDKEQQQTPMTETNVRIPFISCGGRVPRPGQAKRGISQGDYPKQMRCDF